MTHAASDIPAKAFSETIRSYGRPLRIVRSSCVQNNNRRRALRFVEPKSGWS